MYIKNENLFITFVQIINFLFVKVFFYHKYISINY